MKLFVLKILPINLRIKKLRINFSKWNSCNGNSSGANDLRFAGDVKDKNFDLRIIKRKENVFL